MDLCSKQVDVESERWAIQSMQLSAEVTGVDKMES